VLDDHETFSSVVSSHLSVPNGMDPPLHTVYRQLIEPYFEPARMAAFEPVCQGIAARLVSALPCEGDIELMESLARPFALQTQCAFMGWFDDGHEPLERWVRRNHAATLAGDRAAMADVAQEFDGHVRALLELRRRAGSAAARDLTTELMSAHVDGRPIGDDEIVSILRNWTVGELGTIAAAVGILVQYLAAQPRVQSRLRAEPSLLPAAIDEILRLHAPLVTNRRITTRAVEIGGRRLAAGERVSVVWASANRDEAVFGDPDEFRPDRDPADNLLYGAGIHVCPGAPLARLELRTILGELLRGSAWIEPAPGRAPQRARYPGSGFALLPVRITTVAARGPAAPA
jgi:cytochrome P450